LRKSRALIIIRELISHDFPKVRDYFNDEGKSTLLALAEDPHTQITELVSQLLKELSQPRTEPGPIPQPELFPVSHESDLPREQNEVSIFASLELTKPNEPINSSHQGQISETSLFDFIRDDNSGPNINPIPGMEDPFISSIQTPKTENKIVPPKQEPVVSKTTSHLPASVFTALSSLPDATPNSTQNHIALQPNTSSKSLFTDLATTSALNTKQTTSFQTQPSSFQTQPSSFQTQPSSFQTQPSSFQTQPSSFQTQPSSFQTQPSSFQTQPSSFQTQAYTNPLSIPNQSFLPNTPYPPMYPYPYSYYYPQSPYIAPHPYTLPPGVTTTQIPLSGQPNLFSSTNL